MTPSPHPQTPVGPEAELPVVGYAIRESDQFTWAKPKPSGEIPFANAWRAVVYKDTALAAIEALQARNAKLLDQMHHFANADQRLWDEGLRDAESFKSWVQSRARAMLEGRA